MDSPHSSTPRPAAADPGATSLLSRNLGVGPIVFMVVAAAAPLAVVAANLPVLIAQSANAGAPYYFLACTALLLLFSIGFTLMSRYVPNAGAFYSYIQAGLGRVTGTGAAAVAIASYLLLLIGVTAYFGVAAGNLLPGGIPWWVFSLGLLALVAVLGYRDIELSSKVLLVALALETLVVIALDIGVLIHSGRTSAAATVPLSTLGEGVPALGVMFAFYSFIGFEATAVFRNEARDPDRTIPRATYIAVVAIGLFSAVSAWFVVTGVGTGQIVSRSADDPENVVLDLISTVVGPIVADVAKVLLVSSFLACALSFHNIVTRYVFALGRTKMLPARLGEVSTRHHAPSRSSLLVSVVSVVVLLAAIGTGLDPVTVVFTLAGAASSLGVVILMTLVGLATVVYFRKVETGRSRWSTTVAPMISTLGLAVILVLVIANFNLMTGTQAQAYGVMGFVLAAFLAGAGGALITRRRRPGVYARLDDSTSRPGPVTENTPQLSN
ncbi:APC family permease [Streptomyces sp. NPDC004609]|uniref:APC family permease n=1 Tax=Streptomyces sp. NPDC004609 TaxID=3364704 RepID=UPI003686CCD4